MGGDEVCELGTLRTPSVVFTDLLYQHASQSDQPDVLRRTAFTTEHDSLVKLSLFADFHAKVRFSCTHEMVVKYPERSPQSEHDACTA